MIKKLNILVIISIFLFLPLVNASLFSSGDITFSVDQKDYYFKTGEDAVIPLNIENTYGKQINGMLTYTYTQEINQAGMHMSSSNSQSTSFSAEDGKSTQGLNFGTSNSPSDLNIALKFVYTEKESRIVNLDGIRIHFVSDEAQKQSQQNQVKSSSQKYTQPQQQQDPFAQSEQSMQQMMDKMFGSQQQPQNAQQRVQNNQIAQDSSALKQQMQKQMQEQEQMKEEFQKQLANNKDFQKEHQELLNEGYNLTNANFNPASNNTGDFELNYQNKDGGQASLKGTMQNGQLSSIQKDTPEERQKILEQLRKNREFQKFSEQLQKQGFSEKSVDLSGEQNKTGVQVDYANKNNETAAIKAEFVNGTVRNVELINEKEKERKSYLWILPAILLLCILGYFSYKRFFKKPKKDKVGEAKIAENPFDYKAESLALFEKAKKLFEEKKYKDAYMLAGQSLRLYLSYKNGLKKEITNDEIIEYLRKHNKPVKNTKECFNLCSLVEFAKYHANKKDFNKIVEYIKKIMQI